MLLFLLSAGFACVRDSRSLAHTDGPPADLVASTKSLYQQYERAIQTGDRNRLASFYHFQGATVVGDGQAETLTRPGLDSIFRFDWNPPSYFKWDSLTVVAKPPNGALVFGTFLVRFHSAPDTAHFAYVALVEAVDSGMAIHFEHETRLSRR
jgi:hypothetical protein